MAGCRHLRGPATLLAAGEFAPAAEALVRSSEQLPAWYPTLAELGERQRALTEFDHSRVVARVRSSRRFVQDHPSVHELVDQLIHASEPLALPEGAPAKPPEPPPPPPIAAGYEVPADAWPLARCDQRLTVRLGVL